MYEGDLVRPLGFVTLNCGYAEHQLEELLDILSRFNGDASPRGRCMFGEKLTLTHGYLTSLQAAEADDLISLMHEAQPLLARRNDLAHGCVLAGGRVTTFNDARPEFRVTAEELMALADSFFNWKERVHVSLYRKLLPLLKSRQPGTLNSTVR